MGALSVTTPGAPSAALAGLPTRVARDGGGANNNGLASHATDVSMPESCHEHNRSRPVPAGSRPWGIRLSLPENDPMRALLGEDWTEYQWFATEALREAKLEQLRRQFVYYRAGDRPSFVLERVNRPLDDAA